MGLKEAKDLIQVTTADDFRKNHISPEFAVKYNTNDINITYLKRGEVSTNLSNLSKFFEKNNINNLSLKQKNNTINIKEKSKLSGKDIEKISEEGSVWIFNRALVGNQKYKSVDDIKKDEKFKQLESIFGGSVDDEWLHSFFKQQKRLLEEYGKPHWGKFEYGGSKSMMEFIKEMLERVRLGEEKIKYKNWNPSDIWMVKVGAKQKVKNFLTKNIPAKSRSQTIYELNALLEILIRKKELVGVSLKKISKTSENAKFIYVNINIDTKDIFEENLESITNVEEIKLNLSLNSNNEFNNQQASVKIIKNKTIQIKPQTPNRPATLTFETQTGSGGRGGKAEIEKVISLLGDGKKFTNKFNDYPQNTQEFLEGSNLKEFKDIYRNINSKVILSIKTEQEMIDNFTKVFNSNNQKSIYIATYKLMMLRFLNDVFKLSDTTEFWTDVYYLGLKVGKAYAPHGKLY